MERGENFHMVLKGTHLGLFVSESKDDMETNNSLLTVTRSTVQLP